MPSTKRLFYSNNLGSNVRFARALPGSYAALGGISSFTRPDGATPIATSFDANGVLQTIAQNVLRDAHYIGGRRTILLEESRLNNYLHSEQLDSAPWVTSNASVTANAAAAPDGNATADALIEAATNSSHNISQIILNTAWTDNTAQSFSVFVKAGARSWVLISVRSKAAVFSSVYFNTTTGTFGTVTASCTATATPIGNGWYWLRITLNSSQSGATQPNWFLAWTTGNNTSSFLGDGVSGGLFWGADAEHNKAFATSYISTAALTVTRAVDALTLVGSPIVGTLFYHYWDLATSAWASAVAAYAGNAAITPPVNRAYDCIAVVQGTRTAAQCKTILGGSLP